MTCVSFFPSGRRVLMSQPPQWISSMLRTTERAGCPGRPSRMGDTTKPPPAHKDVLLRKQEDKAND